MKSQVATIVAFGATAAQAYIQGFDISSYQPNVDFQGAYNSGARFVIIKVCSLGCQPQADSKMGAG